MSENAWNVLIVDDDESMHAVTRLALSRMKWKDKKLKFTNAMSGKQAREILSAPDAPRFEVALVDVVMESEHAGLELCAFIRDMPSRITRIVLRTGQPGTAPEQEVLQEYAIDYYLSKTAATAEQMTSVIRACLQASEDIRSLEQKGSAG
jgi:CheY-like chemotaxis protein